MIMMLPVFCILLLTAGAATLFQKRFERMLPLVMLGMTLTLYLFGLASFIRGGVFFIVAVSAAALLYLIINIMKRRWSRIWRWTLTPGAAAFVLFAVFAYFVSRNRLIVAGDSFSYWGAVVKTMYYYDVLGNTAGVFALYPHYPPVGCLSGYFFVRFLPAFEEGAVIYGKMLLTFSLLLPLMRNTSWREPVKCAVYAAIAFFAPYFFSLGGSDGIYTDLMVDGLLGLEFAGMLLIYFARADDDDPLFVAAGLAIYASAICLTKPSGLGICLLVVLIIGMDYLLFERKCRTRFASLAGDAKKRRRTIAIPLLALAIAYLSWQAFIAIKLPSGIRYGRYDGNVLAVIAETARQPFTESGIACIKNMALRFVTMNGTGAAFGAPVAVVLLSFGFLAIQVFRTEREPDGKRMLNHVLVLYLCIALYFLSMLVMYLFYMNETEMATLASWDRYVGTIFLGVGIYLLFRWLLQPKVRMRTAYLVMAAAVLAALPVIANQNSSGTTQAEREAYQPLESAALEMDPQEDRIFIVKQTILTDSVVRFLSMPVGTEEDAFVCDDELASTDARQFAAMTEGCTYLYIWSQSDEFAVKYGELFADDPEAYHLYRIERIDGGSIRLYDVSQQSAAG